MQPVSCANTHHDVTDLVNHGMVKNTKKLEYSILRTEYNLSMKKKNS